MLSFRVIPRGISHYLKQSTQQLHTSVKALTAKDPQDTSSSSSSSDSSDSDSDKEDNKAEKHLNTQAKNENDDAPKISDINERLNALLLNIENAAAKKTKKVTTSANSTTATDDFIKTFQVSIKPRKERFQKTREQFFEEKPYAEQLKSAAKDVAQILKGDSSETELELLSQVLESSQPASKNVDDSEKEKKDSSAPKELSSLLTHMKVDALDTGNVLENKRRTRASEMFTIRSGEASLTESVLHAKSIKQPERSAKSFSPELKVKHKDFGIFTKMSMEQTKATPVLLTWEAMEAREMKMSTLSAPENIFQELIQWTEQGKLWRFPINNEQGMEEEEKVHFSEHVFMERHLKGWCPKKGPIRHFMELVCVGLSKNPYLTVEEKVGHITWYKDYFESKHELLHELGVLDDKAKMATEDKKQIQG